ncbi:MAG: SAM-dependent methyltransferase [Patescibacteria group bacterium]|nr:SAM-dependent methyltransferase [Patescibacteria group bacterium]
MKTKGVLYLIPSTLGHEANIKTIPVQIADIINSVDIILAEKPKKTRAFIKRLKPNRPIQKYNIQKLNVHTNKQTVNEYLDILLKGKSIGVIPDAGCPAVADPGSDLALLAHQNNISVIPLTGPSSILLALMASGLNGQNFAFIGYLPRKSEERKKKIISLSSTVCHTGQTQIMIETPYRNQHVLTSLINNLNQQIHLCIAVDLTTPTENIKTMQVSAWRKVKTLPNIKGKQSVFVIGLGITHSYNLL